MWFIWIELLHSRWHHGHVICSQIHAWSQWKYIQKKTPGSILKKTYSKKKSQFTEKHLCLSIFFNKVAGLELASDSNTDVRNSFEPYFQEPTPIIIIRIQDTDFVTITGWIPTSYFVNSSLDTNKWVLSYSFCRYYNLTMLI